MQRILPILALQIAMGGVFAPHAMAEDNETRTTPHVAVLGEAKTQTKPELGRLSVMVQTRGATMEAAVKAHGSRVAKASDVLSGLKDKGVTVQQSSFVSTVEQPPRLPGPNGYVSGMEMPATPFLPAATTTRFQLEIAPADAVEGIIDALAGTGVLQVNSVSYALRDPKGESNKARGLAMRDAAEQARIYAEAGGFRLVEVLAVRDGQAQVEQSNVQYDMPVRATSPSVTPPVQVRASAPATIDTTASVNVTYRIDGRPKDGTVTPRQ